MSRHWPLLTRPAGQPQQQAVPGTRDIDTQSHDLHLAVVVDPGRGRVHVLTGDSKVTAEAVGRRLGIEVIAEVLPDGKAEVVKRL